MPRKKKRPKHGLNLEQRLALYTRYSDMSYSEIAAVTGIPTGTIKSDFHRIKEDRKKEDAATPPPGNAQEGADTTAMQPFQPKPPGFDWEGQLDKAGQVVLALFSKIIQDARRPDGAISEDKQKEALRWFNAFLRAVRAKTGALKINAYIDARSVTINNISPALPNMKPEDRLALLDMLLDYDECYERIVHVMVDVQEDVEAELEEGGLSLAD